MKHTRLNLFIAFFFLIQLLFTWSGNVQAQSNIGFNHFNPPVVLDTQLIQGGNLLFEYQLLNSGNVPLTGTVFFNMMVLDSGNTPYFLGIVDSIQQLVLAPGDTTHVDTLIIQVTPQRFMSGGGVVVIWPSKPGFETTDSAVFSVVVSFNNGIQANRQTHSINVYPNPAHQFVNIDLPVSYQTLIKPKVLNMQGQSCGFLPEIKPGQYLVENLTPGIYLILLNFPGQKTEYIPLYIHP